MSLTGEPCHPCGEGLLVWSSGGVGGVNVTAVDFRAILAELEFAFDASDGDAEAYDAGKHGAAKALGQTAPMFGVGWLVQRG